MPTLTALISHSPPSSEQRIRQLKTFAYGFEVWRRSISTVLSFFRGELVAVFFSMMRFSEGVFTLAKVKMSKNYARRRLLQAITGPEFDSPQLH